MLQKTKHKRTDSHCTQRHHSIPRWPSGSTRNLHPWQHVRMTWEALNNSKAWAGHPQTFWFHWSSLISLFCHQYFLKVPSGILRFRESWKPLLSSMCESSRWTQVLTHTHTRLYHAWRTTLFLASLTQQRTVNNCPCQQISPAAL